MKFMDEIINKEEEYLNNWKRAQADLMNYKKDEMKRMEDLIKFGNEKLIVSVIEIMTGMEMVIKQFDSLLKKYGVERSAVVGQTFNPEVHEAVEPIKDEAKIAEERPGYTLHGKV